jgi:nucleoside-diphosphate-sugar epimerase
VEIMAATAPNVLVLGGCGFLGRSLVEHLVDNNLAGSIRVADKVLPDLAGMSEKQLGIFKGERVEFVQANLARAAEKAFAGIKFDVVFNLAGETKLSQTDEVYKENISDIVTACGAQAKASGVGKWIEVSTAQVYDAGSKASDESSKIKPWTKLAKARLDAEETVKGVGVPYVILRPGLVYGPGDVTSVTPRIICAAVYQHLNEKMEFLWEKGLAMTTIHVDDMSRALWHASTSAVPAGETYNLADTNKTTQGSISDLLAAVFGIKTGFMGNTKSMLATKVAMKQVCEGVNEKHLKPWSDICKEQGIVNTPLTPYLDEELLYKNSLAVDGSKITKTGFTYNHPNMSAADIRASIDYFTALKFFPSGLTK